MVGQEKKRWIIHEMLLSHHSELFNNYFNGSDDDGPGCEEMKLPCENPKIFDLFVRWLYGTAPVGSGTRTNFRFAEPHREGSNITVRD